VLGLLVAAGCTGEDDGGTNGGTAGTADSDGVSGASGVADAQVGLQCVGVQVEPGSPPPNLDGGSGTAGETDASRPDAACPTCPGAEAPAWELNDFQPQSCGYGKSYGLERFRGHTTLVGLFSGWCDFCQAQAVELEHMRQELLMEGRDVQFVIINSADAVGDQQALVDRCAFPLFQDTAEVNAFSLHGGVKDDLIIYDREGLVSAFLPGSGEEGPTILLSAPGYENVKSKILAAE